MCIFEFVLFFGQYWPFECIWTQCKCCIMLDTRYCARTIAWLMLSTMTIESSIFVAIFKNMLIWILQGAVYDFSWESSSEFKCLMKETKSTQQKTMNRETPTNVYWRQTFRIYIYIFAVKMTLSLFFRFTCLTKAEYFTRKIHSNAYGIFVDMQKK